MSQGGVLADGGGPAPDVETLTGNSGGPVGPSGGNINVLGTGTTTVVGNPGTSTLTITPTAGGYPITPYVVGPVGQAGYQTIQAALTAANAAGGGAVFVQPGTYTENLTLFDNTQVVGALGFADVGDLIINGVHTPPVTGSFVFRNVTLQSATHVFSSVAGGSAHLIIGDAAVIVTNGYTFNLPNWSGKLEVFDVNDRGSTDDGFVNNSGGSEIAFFSSAIGEGTLNTMTVSGLVSIFGCAVDAPINCVTGSTVFLEENVHLKNITFSNNSTGEIVNCEIDAVITQSSTGTLQIAGNVINTATSPAVAGAGAGAVTIGGTTFLNSTAISSSLTVTYGTTYSNPNSAYTAVSSTPYVVLGTDYFISCDTTAARTIQLPNAPTKNRVFVIKDRTGGAAANNISVTTVGGVVTIDGAATYTMNQNYKAISLLFNGTSYEVF